jgi:hypothetical protein
MPPRFGSASFQAFSSRNFGCIPAFSSPSLALWLGAYHVSGFGTAAWSQVALWIGQRIWLVIRVRQFEVRPEKEQEKHG